MDVIDHHFRAIYLYSSFNDADLLHSMLVDSCMICRRGGWPHGSHMMMVAAMMIEFDRIFTQHFYLGTHVTSPPSRSPTTNQPPTQPNISANIWRMRTFQTTTLCPCMFGYWLYCVETDLGCKTSQEAKLDLQN